MRRLMAPIYGHSVGHQGKLGHALGVRGHMIKRDVLIFTILVCTESHAKKKVVCPMSIIHICQWANAT